MTDLRDYSFGDWLRLFLNAVPAFILATVLVIVPVVVIAALVWFIIPIGP